MPGYTVQAATCTTCGDTIYSRIHTDTRECTCTATTITNGFVDPQTTGSPSMQQINMDGTVSVVELAEDFTSGTNAYGLIPGS